MQLDYLWLHFKFAAIEKVEQFTCCFVHYTELFSTDTTLKPYIRLPEGVKQ